MQAAIPANLKLSSESILQWNEEIGLPWVQKDLDRYMKLSYPFTHADKIKTPTLFMVGQNVGNNELSTMAISVEALG